MRALLQIDSSQSVPALVEAGRDSDAEVRQGIVAAVGENGEGRRSPLGSENGWPMISNTGVAARKEDTELLKQVNDALLALIKSGELRGIYEKWGIWNGETEQLFAKISSASQPGQVYEEFTQNITKKLTWRERLERYKSYLPPLSLIGAPMTLLISVLGMAVAIVIGLAVALVYLYAPRPASWLARGYVELFRGTPLLIQLYLIFYGLPNIGVNSRPWSPPCSA